MDSKTKLFIDPALTPIWAKVQAKVRLSLDDVRVLYASPDLLGVGWMAKQVKESRYGKKAFYVLNQKLEPTNVCVLSCRFCDFAAKRGDANAYEMTIPEMVEKCSGDISEIHISGGMPPEWKLDHYIAIVRALRQAYPKVGIKAFTAVEVEWAARISKQSVQSVLRQLKEAGLTALPGGGAEVFSERVRKELFPFKIGAKEWLNVHRTAHQLGIPSNATLLYGHIETPEERWKHLEMIRQLQDEAPGFMSFIPLAFQPGTTGLAVQTPTVQDDLKLLAISRLFLDNVPHIKAYWITLGAETASTGLHWGADDIDGTIGGERIMHDAGATSPVQMARARLEELIREAGCEPVERDALYGMVGAAETSGRRVGVLRSSDPVLPPTQPYRVGFIPYLNMVPFHQGFGPVPVTVKGTSFDFVSMSPRLLGLEAEKGAIDAGAMSLVDALRLSHTYEPLGHYGIGLKRSAQSVLLFSKKPLAEFSGVCAVSDETSTSFRLLQVLLEARYGRVGVHYGRVASAMLFDGDADGLLLIGDEALKTRKEGLKGFPVVTDLGEEWFAWQQQPFVFARWMVKKTVAPAVKQVLEEAIRSSLAKPRNGTADQMAYWNAFSYVLTPEHETSIARFEKLLETVCSNV